MTFRVSPGVYTDIIDDSLQPTYVNPSIAAIVGGAKRGPLGPTFNSNYPYLTTLYGKSDPTWGYMLDGASQYLLRGTQLWTNRVVASNATWGLGLIANNWTGGIGVTPVGTSFTTIPSGSSVNYSGVNIDVHDIEIHGTFVAGTSITLTINGTSTATVNFGVSHNATMLAVQQAVITVLNTLGTGGWCDLPVTGANYQILRLISPNAITLVINSVTLTGAGAPTQINYEADWLCFVVAENPGSWSGPINTSGTPGVAVGITNIDTGVQSRLTVSLTTPILAGQTISMTINGTTFSTTYVTSNNVTLTNLCAAYVAAFPNGVASATVTPSGSSNNLQMVFVAPTSSFLFSVTSQYVSGSGTLPIVSSAVTLLGTPSTGSFNFVVYESFTFASPQEIYLCTFGVGTDGFGNPTQLNYVVNGIPSSGTGNASSRVRVVTNTLFSGLVNGPTNVTNSNYERFLGGGTDGSIPSTQQVNAGWAAFNNPDQITIRLLINAGYTDPTIHQTMTTLASTRQDCFAILDTPSISQDPTDAANFRNNIQNINSFWGAMYSPDVLIYDQNQGVRRYTPPSGLVAASYAYTDTVAAEWFSPAGLTRGIIPQALGLRYIYAEGDRDLLSQAQVNCIRKYGPSFVIWGEYTLQQAMSALQSVAVVRLMITVMTEAASIGAYSVFEPNNPYTWHKIRTAMNAILNPIQTAQGITDYYVQCDATNNTPNIIDERVCLVALWIKPTLSILYLKIDGIVTRQSAVFSVEMQIANNAY